MIGSSCFIFTKFSFACFMKLWDFWRKVSTCLNFGFKLSPSKSVAKISFAHKSFLLLDPTNELEPWCCSHPPPHRPPRRDWQLFSKGLCHSSYMTVQWISSSTRNFVLGSPHFPREYGSSLLKKSFVFYGDEFQCELIWRTFHQDRESEVCF